MRKILSAIAGIALAVTAFASCSSDKDEPLKPTDFDKLAPGLYVTTVDTLSFDPIRVSDKLFVDVNGGFFPLGVNVYPASVKAEADTWSLDSLYWTQIDTIVKAGKPAKPVDFKTSPWKVDTTYKVTGWLWVERAIPDVNPSLRPMIVKLSKSGILYPRDIVLFLSQKPYTCEYPVMQFGLNNNYIKINGRSVSVDELPAVEMKAVRRPDGTFAISER